MANEKIKNRVKQTCTGASTDPLNILSGAAAVGHRKVATAFALGEVGIFVLESGDAYEIFYGTVASSDGGATVDRLERTTVIESNNGNNKIVLNAIETHTVSSVLPEQLALYLDADGKAANKGVYFDATSGPIKTFDLTAFGRSLGGAADAAAARTLLNVSAAGDGSGITSVYLNNTGLKIRDTNASHGLSIVPGSDLTADRTFTLTTGDSNRTLTLNADVTVSVFGASLVDDADAPAARATLGISTFGSSLIDDNDAAAARTTLALSSGDDVTFRSLDVSSRSIKIQIVPAADIAAIGNAINTTAKTEGKIIYDSTNKRIMVSEGSNANSPWWVSDGSASVTPA